MVNHSEEAGRMTTVQREAGCLLRFARIGLALAPLLFLGAGRLSAGVRIPPVPPGNSFVAGYAKDLKPEASERLGRVQKTAFEQYGAPIIVVVITRRADYGGGDATIADFARQWFDAWRIGTLSAGPNGANKGILLLVSL